MTLSSTMTNGGAHAETSNGFASKIGLGEESAVEMHIDAGTLCVNFQHFFGVEPSKVNNDFFITLAEQSYLPKVDEPRADWAVVAAFNSFMAYQQGSLGTVNRFATVGTGSGTDMIAALEVFDLKFAAMTDLIPEVVNTAKRNVMAATHGSHGCQGTAESVYAAAGDLLLPLVGLKPFDLIYENLPNIPLQADDLLTDGQISSTFIGDRSADGVPARVSEALLDLHYLCLCQARTLRLIKPTGAVLSSMGGRVPVKSMLDMADAAGYDGKIISLLWKIQSEPETVIGGYAQAQKQGSNTFYFYPTSTLEAVFRDLSPAAAALRKEQVEKSLLPHRLNALEALEQHHAGVEIGHTVYVMASIPRIISR